MSLILNAQGLVYVCYLSDTVFYRQSKSLILSDQGRSRLFIDIHGRTVGQFPCAARIQYCCYNSFQYRILQSSWQTLDCRHTPALSLTYPVHIVWHSSSQPHNTHCPATLLDGNSYQPLSMLHTFNVTPVCNQYRSTHRNVLAHYALAENYTGAAA